MKWFPENEEIPSLPTTQKTPKGFWYPKMSVNIVLFRLAPEEYYRRNTPCVSDIGHGLTWQGAEGGLGYVRY